jgi:hypothetical protein
VVTYAIPVEPNPTKLCGLWNTVFSWKVEFKFSTMTLDILGQERLCCGNCSVHCSVVNSIPGLYPLDSRGHLHPQIATTLNDSTHCQVSPGGLTVPSWEPLII